MNCPVDNDAMIALEYEDIELDYCMTCSGIWLDAGELEVLFGDVDACRAFLNQGEKADRTTDTLRRCPRCGEKMEKWTTGGEHGVIYDHCPEGDGLWLDAGELQAILTQNDSDAMAPEVNRYLRGLFPESAVEKDDS